MSTKHAPHTTHPKGHTGPTPALASAISACSQLDDMVPGRYKVTIHRDGSVAVRRDNGTDDPDLLASLPPTAGGAIHLRGVLTALLHGFIR